MICKDSMRFRHWPVLLQAVLPFERLVAHLAPVVDRWQMVAFVYKQRIVFVERPVAVFAHKLHFDPLGPESVVFRVELYYRVHGRAAAAFSPGAPRADYDNDIMTDVLRRRRRLGPSLSRRYGNGSRRLPGWEAYTTMVIILWRVVIFRSVSWKIRRQHEQSSIRARILHVYIYCGRLRLTVMVTMTTRRCKNKTNAKWKSLYLYFIYHTSYL